MAPFHKVGNKLEIPELRKLLSRYKKYINYLDDEEKNYQVLGNLMKASEMQGVAQAMRVARVMLKEVLHERKN